jgi:enamine deaminase RidA (YjgF/YER057c/UK114 family)
VTTVFTPSRGGAGKESASDCDPSGDLHYGGVNTPTPGRTDVPAHKFLNPSTMPATRGYTHVVETRGPSRTIYLAGQLGMTPDGKFAGGPGDFRAQATQAFENLKLGLAAAGATFEHAVKVTVYFTAMLCLRDCISYQIVRFSRCF